jgi:VanZ family protein
MTESTNENPTTPIAQWILFAAPVAVMAIIFALSSRSHLPDLDGGRDFQSVIGHFIIYAVLGAALAVVFRSFGWSAGRVFAVAVVIATLYGMTDEFHQSFVPSRDADPFDLLVDFLGAVAGSAAILALSGRRSEATGSLDAVRDRPADESS